MTLIPPSPLGIQGGPKIGSCLRICGVGDLILLKVFLPAYYLMNPDFLRSRCLRRQGCPDFSPFPELFRRHFSDRISLSNARGTRYPVPVWLVAPQRTIPLKIARDRESCPQKSTRRGRPLPTFGRLYVGLPASPSRAGCPTPPCDQGGDSPLDPSRTAPLGKPRGAARNIWSPLFSIDWIGAFH